MLFYFKRLLHIFDVKPGTDECVCLWVSGSGTLCASWQCLEVPRGPPPSLAVHVCGLGGVSLRPGCGAGGQPLPHVTGEEEVCHRWEPDLLLSLISSSFENCFSVQITSCRQVVARMFSRWLLSGQIKKKKSFCDILVKI